MRLLYLYIHEYRNIKQQGIPFTSEFIFTPVHEGQELAGIEITGNDNHIGDFFENDRIKEVTAIVGENGVGKSTLLTYIRGMCTEKPQIQHHDVYILFDDFQDCFITSPGHSHLVNPPVKPRSKATIRYQVQQLPSHDVFQHKTATIYHNNIIDYNTIRNASLVLDNPNPNQEHSPSIIDISTSFLIQSSGQMFTDLTRKKYDVEQFILQDLKRQIDYVHALNKYHFPFVTPEKLVFEISRAPVNSDDQDRFTAKLRQMADTIYAESDGIDRFIFLLDLYTIEAFFRLYKTIFQKKLHSKISQTFVMYISSSIDQVHEKISDACDFYINTEAFIRKKPFVRKQMVRDFVSHYYSMRDKFKALPASSIEFKNDYMSVVLDVNRTPQDQTSTLVNSVFQTITPLNPLCVYWRSMSAGELSLLNLRARLYEAREYVNSSMTLILLFDESDLNYHPEWQRGFLKAILDFVPILFPQNTLQLIFSSNTPFIVSDLPQSKVVHLKKSATGATEIETMQRPETFASNIHTLLSSNFYLTSFLGEFAKKKIEGIIDELTSGGKNLSEARRGNIKKLIQQVGEKVIQERLKQIYETSTGERFATETENEDEIEALRKRIAEYDAMKNRLNKQSNQDDQD